MEKPVYTVSTRVNEEQLRRGIRTGQRRWAVWIFAAVCTAAVIFGIVQIVRADSFDDMYTWIVCIIVGGFSAYPAFTAGRRQEDQICGELLGQSGTQELCQKIQFYGDRLTYTQPGRKAASISYADVQKVAESGSVVTIVAANRAQVFIDRGSLPDGLTGFLREKTGRNG